MKWCCYYTWLFLTVIMICSYNFWFRKKFKKYNCKVIRYRILESGDLQSHHYTLNGQVHKYTPYLNSSTLASLKTERKLDKHLLTYSNRILASSSSSSPSKSSSSPSSSSSSKSSTSSSNSPNKSTKDAPHPPLPAPPSAPSSSLPDLNNTDIWITVKNPLTGTPKWMGIGYLFLAILLFFYIIAFFSFKSSEERNPYSLSKVSLFTKLIGFVIRVFPILMKMIHYVILFQIGFQVYKIWSNPHCKTITHKNKLGIERTSRLRDFSLWSLVVYAFFWVSFFFSFFFFVDFL